jgi:hypothetical protein
MQCIIAGSSISSERLNIQILILRMRVRVTVRAAKFLVCSFFFFEVEAHLNNI